MPTDEVVAELTKNQQAYEAVRDQMEKTDLGRIVLLHDGQVVSVYNDLGDAYDIGREKYGLGHFSLHRVGERPFDLGWHSIDLNLNT